MHALTGLVSVSGCASVDVKPETEPPFTHSVAVRLGPFDDWTDPATGNDSALAAAQRTCGVDATAEALMLTQRGALYDFRGYGFACPQPEEVIQ